MTLVDTSVILDVLLQGSLHGDTSQRQMEAALRVGKLAVNEVIAAELAPAFENQQELWGTLRSAQLELVAYPTPAVFLAGQAFRRYRRRGGARQRILPDFMIGAHALAIGAKLLTRDKDFFRDYFPKLHLA